LQLSPEQHSVELPHAAPIDLQLDAVGDGSTVGCTGSGGCDVTCSGDCSVACPGSGVCRVHCAPNTSCAFSKCDKGEASCPDNVIVCNGAC
jgi:hypothetical protein